MLLPSNSQLPAANRCVSLAILSFILLAAPAAVLAHAEHGNEFHQGSEASQSNASIQVDAQTAKLTKQDTADCR